ncbi:MAG: hypothetical protein JO250_14630 [Armatimonadetes bacterium]|nr:hypothetical protein [Armatimonadota bacterium]
MWFFRPLAALALGTAILAAPPAVQAKARPAAPAGSFLHRQARSVPQLVQEVQADPAARRRFARYFHIPEGQVAAYLGRTLRAGALPQPGRYTVFFVAASGLVYPTRMDLRPGTPVFVGRDGKPALLQGTGNPLTPFATAVEVHVIEGGPSVRVGGTVEQIIPAAGADIPVPANDSAPPPATHAASR